MTAFQNYKYPLKLIIIKVEPSMENKIKSVNLTRKVRSFSNDYHKEIILVYSLIQNGSVITNEEPSSLWSFRDQVATSKINIELKGASPVQWLVNLTHNLKVVFESCLIQIQDGNGLKAMAGLISAPNSGSFMEKKKIQVAKWGKPTKNIFKKH